MPNLSGSPHLFLRENCRCSECLHDLTQQRLVDVFNLPLDIRPSSTETLKIGLDLTCQPA
jgi:trimethyllysine dioxygenase